MTPGDMRRVINALDAVPLGAAPERGFRPSLAGFQRKALLGRTSDGTWQFAHGDAPSTWILKPDGPYPMAANEATCVRLAAACGLPVSEAELLDVAGLPVLAVKRYDRREAPAGDIPARVHQEDGCQAAALPPALKYEEQGGPALRDLAEVIRNFGDPRDVTSLLRRTTFNMAVGNADAHAKNFSVLHEPGTPAISLAPLYDVLSTIALQLTDRTGRPMRGHAPEPARRRAGRHTGGDLGEPCRRGGSLGYPAAGSIAGRGRNPGPSACRHPRDARRRPGPRHHPRASRADQPGLIASYQHRVPDERVAVGHQVRCGEGQPRAPVGCRCSQAEVGEGRLE
jgi:HipA-like C-terminal domain